MNSESAPGQRSLQFKDNKVFTVTQSSGQGTVLNSSSTNPIFGSKFWTTADLLQFSSWASVFDQYKIDCVEVWIEPYGAALASGYNGNVKIYSVVDYDDANAPTSLATLQDYENCISTRCTEGHYRKFVPHIADAAYAGTFTGFQNKKSDWIDCGSTTVQHYGFKWGVDTTVGSQDLHLDMHTRITVSFRNPF